MSTASSEFKASALAIFTDVEASDLELELASGASNKAPLAKRAVTKLLATLSDADADAAALRVQKMRSKHPQDSANKLAERLIRIKVQQTAAIGAASSGLALIPVIGLLSALSVGVAAEITSVFKLQADMVLEVAAAYGFSLDELEEQTLIFLVTGVSMGGGVVLNRVGEQLSVELGERFTEKWLAATLPLLGLAVSSSSNAVATYIVGQRARVYFRDGPEEVGDFKDSLLALADPDESRLAAWLTDTSDKTRDALTGGVSTAGEAVVDAAQSAGGAVVTGSSKTASALVDAGQSVGGKLADAATGVGEVARGLFDKRGKKNEADEDEPEEGTS